MLNTKALAASVSAPPAVYIEDVFSTYLYTGNGSTQTITNGIDLAGEGGLVWIKSRSQSNSDNLISDTNRGNNATIRANTTAGQVIFLDSFGIQHGSSGFTVQGDNNSFDGRNNNGATYASWTFRKAEKFFDVVTYTGNGADRAIPHSLGVAPGCIIIKRTDTLGDWIVYHRGLTSAGASYSVKLNTTAAEINQGGLVATSTTFTLYDAARVNSSGGTYVAYLFAHDAGGFGDAGDQSVVKCGSYTGTAAAGNFVDLGWEPQWVLIKSSSGAYNWHVFDNMRGITDSSSSILYANISNAELSALPVQINSTGFTINTTGAAINQSTGTYIYIAIRRGPMKTPTSGTEVFNAAIGNNTGSEPAFTSGFPVDFAIWGKSTTGDTFNRAYSRLTGGYMVTATTATEVARLGAFQFQDGWYDSSIDFTLGNSWMFRRAPGFFDVVAYTGDGTTGRTINHSLQAKPELIIHKYRNLEVNWTVYSNITSSGFVQTVLNSSTGKTDYVYATSSFLFSEPTSTAITVNTGYNNSNTTTSIVYLFATLTGVSKVGSYTGTGTTLSIDCGFTAGARFVLIKRTDDTGDWFVWDTARGIISGDDSYLLLNSTAAEVTNTDYIDPLSSGFQISSTAPAAINASGGSFIFLAIA